ncbi:MAG: cyclase family protein [Deltaproteobacteria bacterium]|nr:cyclase family protein [Deltaproteobacteria bacterium]
MRVVALVAAIAVFSADALAADPWYPSKYGKDDTIGAANNLSPEIVVEAAKLVKTGKTYSLGVTTGPDTPAYGTRNFQIFTEASIIGTPLGTNKATGNDDFLATWMGIGSQLDGLGHLGIDYTYYNGHEESEFLRPHGLLLLSTDKVPPIVTRGVLLDFVALQGADLAPGKAINRAEIEAAVAKQGTPIRKGDVVLLHTGWLASMAAKDKKAFLEKEPGLGKGGAEYLASLGVVAVGSDGWAVEAIPFENPDEAFPVHQILLARNGIYILENMNVGPLAADRGYEFLFVLGQPKFAGAVQAIINPIAIR